MGGGKAITKIVLTWSFLPWNCAKYHITWSICCICLTHKHTWILPQLFLCLLSHYGDIWLIFTVLSFFKLMTKAECCLQFILSILFQGWNKNFHRKCTLIKRSLVKQNCLLSQSLEGVLFPKEKYKGHFSLPLQDVHVSVKPYHICTGNNYCKRRAYNQLLKKKKTKTSPSLMSSFWWKNVAVTCSWIKLHFLGYSDSWQWYFQFPYLLLFQYLTESSRFS